MTYQEFIKNKIKTIQPAGFEVQFKKLNPLLFKFQKHIVQRALKQGRFAIFGDCGTGKTAMQLEWSHQIQLQKSGVSLIVSPLAVVAQTIQEGVKFGIEVSELDTSKALPKSGICNLNYEQVKNLPQEWIDEYVVSVVLDESSILKNFTGKTKKLLLGKFANTPFKLPCTATPSPNDLNEIGNHSEFLGILDAQDMRSRWFVREQEGVNNYRLKKHGERDFYGWISSWAVMFSHPREIGFEMEGYDLPNLNPIECPIKTKIRIQDKLFNDSAVNATNFNQELKLTLLPRIEEAVKIAAGSNEPFLIWVNHNDEGAKICELLPEAVEVTGKQNDKIKAKRLLDFANGEFRVLVTKKKIASFGMNFQHCNNQIFAALDFSFEQLYQAMRRSWRFGQKKEVNIYLITTDTMENVIEKINKKKEDFEKMKTEMRNGINQKEYGLKMDYSGEVYETSTCKLVNGDSCELIKTIPDSSIDFSVFSPPFSSLFTYSDNWRDMGNCESDEQFFEQYSYLLRDLHRVMKPGSIIAVHTKDLARYKGSSGFTGLYDFTGANHRAVEAAGFRYHSKICIWTDPVMEMYRTNTQRLLYSQVRADSSSSGVGLPEYITIFKKWEGIEGETRRSKIDNKNKDNFPLEIWQKWASPVWGERLTPEQIAVIQDYIAEILNKPVEEIDLSEIKADWVASVWFDIQRTDVLNNRDGTDMGDEKHIAPLQLKVIEKCIAMWSMPGDIVFSPFAGIGSEGYTALRMSRRFIGFELKESYFEAAKRNLAKAEQSKNQLRLF